MKWQAVLFLIFGYSQADMFLKLFLNQVAENSTKLWSNKIVKAITEITKDYDSKSLNN